jgi:hypothetical protein
MYIYTENNLLTNKFCSYYEIFLYEIYPMIMIGMVRKYKY